MGANVIAKERSLRLKQSPNDKEAASFLAVTRGNRRLLRPRFDCAPRKALVASLSAKGLAMT
jgi:hypothetical protein